MLTLNNANFKVEVLESKTPVVVDFWAVGCGPCRTLEPTLKKVEEKLTNVKFAKIEASDGMDVFRDYGVGYVPTLLLFKDGKVVDKKGLASEKDLTEWLSKV